jgi:hypothetical protein
MFTLTTEPEAVQVSEYVHIPVAEYAPFVTSESHSSPDASETLVMSHPEQLLM